MIIKNLNKRTITLNAALTCVSTGHPRSIPYPPPPPHKRLCPVLNTPPPSNLLAKIRAWHDYRVTHTIFQFQFKIIGEGRCDVHCTHICTSNADVQLQYFFLYFFLQSHISSNISMYFRLNIEKEYISIKIMPTRYIFVVF